MGKVENKEILKQCNDIIDSLNLKDFTAHDIQQVNHRPHIPVVGLKTMTAATNGIIDGDEPCAHPDCRLKLNEHESDKVMFILLTNKVLKTEANHALMKIKSVLEANNIDGVVFVQKSPDCTFY